MLGSSTQPPGAVCICTASTRSWASICAHAWWGPARWTRWTWHSKDVWHRNGPRGPKVYLIFGMASQKPQRKTCFVLCGFVLFQCKQPWTTLHTRCSIMFRWAAKHHYMLGSVHTAAQATRIVCSTFIGETKPSRSTTSLQGARSQSSLGGFKLRSYSTLYNSP